jgi:uncharacterized membrane protein YdjX (TVP38/TMEM64 family)
MNKNLKLFLGASYIILLLVFLYFIFSYVEITRLNEFLYYKQLQVYLEEAISSNLYFNLLIFFLFSVLWVALLGFGSPLLIISGILFGKWIGTFISVLSISIGALILYSIASYFFKELVSSIIKKKFSKYIDVFKKNEFIYFLSFRIVGGFGIPFGLQNILPVVFNLKKSNYFFASFFGFFPMFYIWNTIGAGLNDYIKQADDFNFMNLILKQEIYLPAILFIIIMFISVVIKKRIFDAPN